MTDLTEEEVRAGVDKGNRLVDIGLILLLVLPIPLTLLMGFTLVYGAIGAGLVFVVMGLRTRRRFVPLLNESERGRPYASWMVATISISVVSFLLSAMRAPDDMVGGLLAGFAFGQAVYFPALVSNLVCTRRFGRNLRNFFKVYFFFSLFLVILALMRASLGACASGA